MNHLTIRMTSKIKLFESLEMQVEKVKFFYQPKQTLMQVSFFVKNDKKQLNSKKTRIQKQQTLWNSIRSFTVFKTYTLIVDYQMISPEHQITS